MNGRDAADENVRRFEEWARSKTDADFRALARGGKLARSEIIKECGFARSVLAQNPRVKTLLAELEAVLRARGILSSLAPVAASGDGFCEPEPLRQAGQADAASALQRVKALEIKVQVLAAENEGLRARLERFAEIQRVLVATGRLPR